MHDSPLRLLAILGTRPEAIKTAPVALEAARRRGLAFRTLATGQQDALFDDAFAGFSLMPDSRLDPIPRDPDPAATVDRLVAAIVPRLADDPPDMVLVQGDTSSAYAGAIAAERLGIAIGHVEAGLRSGDLRNPWPEEYHRVMIDRMATLLFAPTQDAAANLRGESGIAGTVLVTGNTGIDALLAMNARLEDAAPPRPSDPRLILLTCHRRESFGAGIENICTAALRLADRGDVRILCPVHTNPAVGETVRVRLGRHPAIMLTGALPYRETVAAMAASHLILTDSGGIQEEAPALGIPTLVLRDVTERPEALATGNLALVGTDPKRIVHAASRLLDDPAAHAAMSRPAFPYGHGDASVKILDAIERYFSRGAIRETPLPFASIRSRSGAPKGA